MSAGSGDMVTVLSLDDYEYVTGLRSAAAETRKFAHESAESAGMLGEHHHLHRAAHKAAHLAMGASFAMTSGEAESGLIGGLEKAATLAPMIGMQFGTIGTAIGVTGGIFATALLGPMKLMNEQAKEFAKSMSEAASKWDKLAKEKGSDVAFGSKLSRMDATTSPEEILKQKQALEDEAKAKQAELDEKRREHAALQAAAKKSENEGPPAYQTDLKAAMEHPLDTLGGNVNASLRWLGDATGITDSRADADAKAKATNDVLKKSLDDIQEKEREIQTAKERAEQLGEKLDDSMSYQEAIEDQKKIVELEREREAIAERIGKEILTPLEKAKEKQKELDDARARDIIDDDTYAKASELNAQNLAKAKTKGPEQHNAAAVGAGAQYEAIRASIKASEHGADSPGVKELRDLVELNKQQLGIQQEIAKGGKDVGIAIPGGAG